MNGASRGATRRGLLTTARRSAALLALLALASGLLRLDATAATTPLPLRAASSGAPSASGALFSAQMQALWRGIAAGSVREAAAAFFPEGAYVKLKAIANPAGDFTGRLYADFAVDVAAAHRLLAPRPATARVLRVIAVQSYAHYIPVGVCANDLGYYELPNTRLVYEERGEVRSFGIASMISWGGRWYVIHLGAVLRAGSGGEVDAPERGPGWPRYSSTC